MSTWHSRSHTLLNVSLTHTHVLFSSTCVSFPLLARFSLQSPHEEQIAEEYEKIALRASEEDDLEVRFSPSQSPSLRTPSLPAHISLTAFSLVDLHPVISAASRAWCVFARNGAHAPMQINEIDSPSSHPLSFSSFLPLPSFRRLPFLSQCCEHPERRGNNLIYRRSWIR